MNAFRHLEKPPWSRLRCLVVDLAEAGDTLWLKAGPISNQLFDTPDAPAVLNDAHEDLMKALASGRKKLSMGRKRPIRIPSGSATAIASARPNRTRYIV